MKSYGLEMVGPFILERVSALPEWNASMEGRITYLTTNDSVYLATSTGWVLLGPGGGSGSCEDCLIRKYASGIDATESGQTLIYTVPDGQLFVANTFEVIIEEIFGTGDLPEITFGTGTDPDHFVAQELLSIDPIDYRRQIWDKPYSAALTGTEFRIDIVVPSTYTICNITAVVTGYLIPFSVLGPNNPYPAYRELYRAEEFTWQ